MKCEYWNMGGMIRGKAEIGRHELFPVTL